MKTYRVYTEDKGIPKLRLELENIVANYFDGFTVIDGAVGHWLGARENSLIFEIVTDGTCIENDKVKAMASEIKRANVQEAILITSTKTDSELV